ncbi:MAG: tRNA preQ1(34) S-adenosylmethionine ribosyltransferase-isomerase QueA [Clostridia bacterium]|nr:tRNA preQ1(34) S-adenosylmethionine ribosyltransferase-isomerase QueA [Clostridia bacterium]
MKTSDFYYDLPKELIAQSPAEKRDESRLMTIDRRTGEIGHFIFRDILDMINEDDLLVINDSKVIPARLIGVTDKGHEAEVLLLRCRGADVWETIVRPGKKLRAGNTIIFGGGILRAEVREVLEDGNRMICFDYDKSGGENFFSVIDKVGQMPLPPYITEKLRDKDRYQTVYANEPGSAAAPTAGLHFTKELMARLKDKGVEFAPVMLHVGLGTFRPVKVENINDHVMHSEFFTVSAESADKINSCRGRVIAVGTTSCRTIESASDEKGIVRPMSADTGIFIYPGYKFKATDALITNFHLPESTLLMLVSAFSSREIMLNAYKEAVKEKYRFFSFGDCCFLY